MQKKNNKIIIVILIILFFAIFGILIYSLTNKNTRIVETEKPKPSFPVIETIYNAITGNNTENNATNTEATSTEVEYAPIKYLLKVYNGDSAGEVVYTQTIKASTSTEEDRAVTYVLVLDKESGYVYSGNSDNNYVMSRMSNTDFTNINRAEFTKDGKYVAIEYTNTTGENEVYIGRVPQTENANLINVGIITGAKNFRSSIDSKSFIYQKLTDTGNDIYLFDLTKNTERLLFSIGLFEINTNYNNLNQITISTRPTYIENQKTFLYDIKNKSLTFYGENPGSININNKNLVSIYTTGSSLFRGSTGSKVKTLADKCAFSVEGVYLVCGGPKNISSNAKYPEDWYKGKINFQDNIYLLNPNNSYESSLLDIQNEIGEDVDIRYPQIYNNDFIFRNKTNGNVFLMNLDPFLEGNSLGE